MKPNSLKVLFQRSILSGVLFFFGHSLAMGKTSLATPPNIVVISLDTLRPDHLDLFGYKRMTASNLADLAQESIVFREAYSTSCWTLPAHASFFTGLQANRHGLMNVKDRIAQDSPMLTEELSGAGYYCAAFVNSCPLHPEYGFDRGFAVYDNYSARLQSREGLFDVDSSVPSPHDTVTSPVIAGSARHWLRNNQRRPFFLFLHFYDIHDSYLPPGDYGKKFDADYSGPVNGTLRGGKDTELSQRDLEHLIALYDGEIAWVDYHLGTIMDELKNLDLWKSTALVIFSDHGEEFNDHGKYLHGHTLYEELIRSLIMVRWPARYREGVECQVPVSLIQLRESIRHIAGLPRSNREMPTLFELIDRDSNDRHWPVMGSVDTVFSMAFVRQENWKCILDRNTSQSMLFDLSSDPEERQDLSSKRPEVAKRLQRILEPLMDSRDRAEFNNQAELTLEQLENLKALGYF